MLAAHALPQPGESTEIEERLLSDILLRHSSLCRSGLTRYAPTVSRILACRLLAAAADDPRLWGGGADEGDAAALAGEVACLEGALLGGPGLFRRFLEGQLAAPAVCELFAGSTATSILPTALR